MSDFRFSHLGVAVPDIDQALPIYEQMFGYHTLSGPFDDPIQLVSVCFVGNAEPGDVTIELIAPSGDKSPICAILAKGLGAYHVCYEVTDLDETVDRLRSQGCMIVAKPVPAVAFSGRRIAWLYLPTRQLVEVLERE